MEKNTYQRWKKWLRITGLAAARWNTRKTSWMMVMQNRFTVQCAGIKKSLDGQEAEPSESLGKLALDIKAIIVGHAKRDWRDNVIVHRNMKKALDDLLFDYMEDQKLDWPLDTIDIIIDEIMMIAKKGY